MTIVHFLHNLPFLLQVSLRYHVQLFRTWNTTNPSVRLQIPRPVKTQQKQKHLTMHFLCKNNKKETMV